MTPQPGASIVVVGGLNMDIHLFGARRGSSGPLTAENYLVEPGGKGANQARAASRLGSSVSLVGQVGDDEFGAMCVEAVASDGVRTEAVGVASETRTGFVVIELVSGHHITRVFVPGANNMLSWSAVETALQREPACGAVLCQAEVPAPVLHGLVEWCRARTIPLFLDPAPPNAVTPAVLTSAEVVTPDMDEAGGLAGRVVDDEVTARLAVGDLLALGARRVVVKLGALGSLWAEADRPPMLVPTLDVEAVDETGAGDVFIAALATARIGGSPWEEAVRLANVASALSVAAPGLYLPTWDEVVDAARQG
jgi:ribokinase